MSRENEVPGTSPAPGEVRLERWLPGPAERVWPYLTESEKRGRWLAPGAMELRVGGRVEHRFRHADLSHEKTPPAPYEAYEAGHVMTGTITRCEPPRLLAYTWGGGDDESEVTFQVEPQAGGEVLLIVTQRRLRSVRGMANVAAGWHAHLGILIDHLQGRPPRGFWSAHALHEADYAVRLAGAEPASPAETAPSSPNPAIPVNAIAEKVTPFLMFEGRAEEAMTFYLSLFPDAAVESITRYGAAGPGPEGTVMTAVFTLCGQRVMCSDSFVQHAFTFTPSLSFFVDCAGEEQVDARFAALSEGGKVLMPAGDYGFSRRFAWVQDRFGVSWQLNLPHG